MIKHNTTLHTYRVIYLVDFENNIVFLLTQYKLDILIINTLILFTSCNL